VLDLLLIPRLGGLGAAIATTSAYTVGGLVAAGVFVRSLGAVPRELVPRRADAAWMLRRARGLTARAGAGS
jgi:Na+-driven multidrug efflux pump